MTDTSSIIPEITWTNLRPFPKAQHLWAGGDVTLLLDNIKKMHNEKLLKVYEELLAQEVQVQEVCTYKYKKYSKI